MPQWQLLGGDEGLTSGDSYTGARRLVITVTDPDGAALDLSASTLTFMVKVRLSDNDIDALITKVSTDVAEIEIASPQTGATKGKAYLTLEEDDTYTLAGRYVWELEADDAAGKLTLAKGAVYIASDLIEGAAS